MKSQSSIEFMMNYGWMILLVAVIGFLLFSLGVFDPFSFGGMKVIELSSFQIDDASLNNYGNLSLYFASKSNNLILNNLKYEVEGFDCEGDQDLNLILTPNLKELTINPLGDCGIDSKQATVNIWITYKSSSGLQKLEKGKIILKISNNPQIPHEEEEELYLTINSPKNLTYYSNNLLLSLSTNADNSIYNFNGTNHLYTGPSYVNFDEGFNELTVTAFKGNESLTKNVYFFTDLSNNITFCQQLNNPGKYSIRNNISNDTNCLIINANNIELDCNGFTINYSTLAAGYGIKADLGFSNITIKNCNIIQESANINSFGIYLGRSATGTNTQGHLIENNNITTIGAGSYGINTYRVINSKFNNNIISTNGTTGYGLYFRTTFLSEFTNNSFNTNEALSVFPYTSAVKNEYNNSFYGNSYNGREIIYYFDKNNEIIKDVINASTIILAGSSNVTLTNISLNHEGLKIMLSSNIIINDSDLKSDKRASYPYSVYGNSYNNSLINSKIFASGITGYGVYIDTAPRNITIINNEITTNGTTSHGIYMRSLNSSIINNTIVTYQATSYGIYPNSMNQLIESNTINTYGSSAYGIYFYNAQNCIMKENKIITNGTTAYGIYFRTSANNTFVNNSLFTGNARAIFFLNSATKQHYNQTFINNTERGKEIIYLFDKNDEIISGIHNVSGIIIAQSNNLTLLNSSALNEGLVIIFSNNSKIINSELAVNERDSYAFSPNYNSLNNSLLDSSIKTQGINAHGVYSDATSNNTLIINNTLLTNSTPGYGIFFAGSESLAENNNIQTLQASSYGFYSSATKNEALSNNITTYGTTGYGAYSINSFNSIRNNNITTLGGTGYGIYLTAAGTYPEISGNIIETLGSRGYGIYIRGIYSNISGNNVLTKGATGYAFYSNSNHNIVYGNYFNTLNTAVYTIYFSASQNNTLYNNIINTSRAGSGAFYTGTIYSQIWNTTKTLGTNIIGGSYLGGNYWANLPGTGYSQTCTDSDVDGICDLSYTAYTSNIDYLPLK